MATHSSILAWRIPWTEETVGLQSTGSQSQTRLKQLSMHTYSVRLRHRAWYMGSSQSPSFLKPATEFLQPNSHWSPGSREQPGSRDPMHRICPMSLPKG